ncbi:MAG: glycoside hydrolase family 2 TIM barrel-domain containing protein [Nitrososphaerota archaeon]|nr:beta galactosidase jelly roll domain-containing protein [Candidatus Bathyarchaeota archaeon]MDW8049306.1 glycoside hydrolase family 2 TIM barrel-domain containing protein [Nitrososphaerota archaeon]
MVTARFGLTREILDLSGFWRFRIDPEGVGEREEWFNCSTSLRSWDKLYVPANWNEQCSKYTWYMGTVWYAKDFFVPKDWVESAVTLCFEGVNYKAKVWVNGSYLGEHEGGFTSFSFRVEKFLRFGGMNRTVIMVDNTLSRKTIPPGENMNRTYFDFFHYGGIYREVFLSTYPKIHVSDVTIKTDIQGEDGIVNVDAKITNELDRPYDGTLKAQIIFEDEIVCENTQPLIIQPFSEVIEKLEFRVREARFWDVRAPNLYNLRILLLRDEEIVDEASERFGIRTVKVENTKILLNGKPVFLKGFGRHEDFPILGKALNGAILRRDFDLMVALGANSFRTTHYPYSRTHLDLADENGFLVILEIPTVGIFKSETKGVERLDDPELIEKAKRMLKEAIQRDKNRPSVIMYSLFNEPSSDKPEFLVFLRELVEEARRLDSSRPVTFVSNRVENAEGVLDLIDVICQNIYYGWYFNFGDLETSRRLLKETLETLHAKQPNKPIIVTEFGAEAIAGLHSDPPEMWTEEYQAEFIRTYWEVLTSTDYVAGGHIWNFADFRTPQGVLRTILNRKGIFTRTREPKYSTKVVKELFTKTPDHRLA